jgi:hypothetical protein
MLAYQCTCHDSDDGKYCEYELSDLLHDYEITLPMVGRFGDHYSLILAELMQGIRCRIEQKAGMP